MLSISQVLAASVQHVLVTLLQSCSIITNMNRSRPILNSISDMKLCMSTRARIPTHYETLKVAQDSTQDDIKSAYYELSKQYHPDKNQSSDAKKQFQSLSDAYEVLGNFSKRKQYDRDLSARGQRATTIKRPTYEMGEDPLAAFYKSRMANYDPVRAHETKANFDFETWTQAHYGQTLRRSLKDKRSKILREHMKTLRHEELAQDRAGVITISLTTACILVGLLIQSWWMSEKYDRNIVVKQPSKGEKT